MTKKGQCYRNSIELLARLKRDPLYAAQDALDQKVIDSACLVHGDVTASTGPEKGQRFQHAWVEAGGYVMDGDSANPVARTKEEFRQEFSAIERVRYNLEEAEGLAREFGYIGPWDLLGTDGIKLIPDGAR
jgi:hypothetical protein